MKSKEFPLCCAADVLSDFGYTDITYGHSTGYPKEEIRVFIREEIKYMQGGFLFIMLNAEQRIQIGELIIAEGFKMIESSLNPNHKTMVYLYSYNYSRQKRLEKKRNG